MSSLGKHGESDNRLSKYNIGKKDHSTVGKKSSRAKNKRARLARRINR